MYEELARGIQRETKQNNEQYSQQLTSEPGDDPTSWRQNCRVVGYGTV